MSQKINKKTIEFLKYKLDNLKNKQKIFKLLIEDTRQDLKLYKKLLEEAKRRKIK